LIPIFSLYLSIVLESTTLKGYITPQIAVLAQLVERLLAKQKAAGSRPAYRTIFFLDSFSY
jgi:hypothetical protein